MNTFFNLFSDTPRLKSDNLVIRGVGRDEVMPPVIVHRRAGLGDFMVMLFQSPALGGTQVVGDYQPANTLFIWAPGVCQYYGNASSKFTHSWIHCDGPIIHQFISQNALPLNRPFKLSDPALFLSILSALYAELTTHTTPDELIATQLLASAFRDMARQLDSSSNPIPERLRLVREHIDRYFSTPLTLAALAERAHLSPTHFARLFRTFYHISPIDYLIRRRIQQATYLLKGANLKIAEVASLCGYDDPYYFSKLYKKHSGHSPTEIRQTVRHVAPKSRRRR